MGTSADLRWGDQVEEEALVNENKEFVPETLDYNEVGRHRLLLKSEKLIETIKRAFKSIWNNWTHQ